MKVVFVAEIDKFDVKISSERPGMLLATLKTLGHETPTVEKLLMHLFSDGVAYSTGAYSIYVKAE